MKLPTKAEVWAVPDRTWQEWSEILGMTPGLVSSKLGPGPWGYGFRRKPGQNAWPLLGGPCIECDTYVTVEDAADGVCEACRSPVPEWKRAYDKELAAYMERHEAGAAERKRKVQKAMSRMPYTEQERQLEAAGRRTRHGDNRRDLEAA